MPPIHARELFGESPVDWPAGTYVPFSLPEGVEICHTGVEPPRIWIITAGTAVVSETDDTRKRRNVEPDEVLGLTETLAGLPSTTTILTSSPCEGRSIGLEELAALFQARPELAVRMLSVLSRVYVSTYRRLIDMRL
jgi:CRP-like cAMP-binding protein